ncbi:DNA internalization-related competence protein ComEC/Rec2 [Pantoea sp. USHLN256]|uniref:DNA internalization-related competence protein ComEC/Rec2 n=1 Tax=Pantoea sp. USHLN256 TaxID=3081293 RepID=UPI00301AF56D
MRISWIVLARMMIVSALPLGVLPQIPETSVIVAIAGFALLLGVTPNGLLRIMGVGLLLLSWAMVEARHMVNTIELLAAAPIEATVRITEVREEKQQLTAQILRVGDRYQFPPVFVTLNNAALIQSFCSGQRWKMKLKLRPVHGRLNEGEFDIQRFAMSNHMPLQGRIIGQQSESLSCSWRTALINYHWPAFATLQHPAIIQALAFGIRTNMTEEQRQLLRETGTAHLMAISGMHIALAASVGWLLARAIQVILPAHLIGYLFPLIVSVITAATYTWVSGSHAPAQRAIVALILWIGIRAAGWQLTGWQVWTLCIGGLLALDPLTVLSESFWLSALAVAMLIVWYQWFSLPPRFRTQRRWLLLQLLHLQLGMMILMAPLQIFLFQGLSLSALVANLMAVPVVSFITVPLILLAMLLPAPVISSGLWSLADLSITTVMSGLQSLPAGWWAWSDTLPAIVLLWVGMLFWRSGLAHRSVMPCLSLVIAIIVWRNNAQRDDWQIDMIDVGHGLAIAITQGNEVVLYDVGPAWKQDDAGARVLLPWLQYQGRKLHSLILSHKHLDHRGGLHSVLNANPTIKVRSALGEEGHLPCHRGQKWQWGKLQFTALWPPANQTQGQNNDSCVIHVDDGKISLLLTGDIELEAERKIVALEHDALKATFLQVPHHGSRTSSGSLLLRNVAGQAALASLARYNAWRMPAPAVVERYRQQGYRWYDTGQSGQIHIAIRQGHWQIKGLREQIMPRWYHQWFGVKRESR